MPELGWFRIRILLAVVQDRRFIEILRPFGHNPVPKRCHLVPRHYSAVSCGLHAYPSNTESENALRHSVESAASGMSKQIINALVHSVLRWITR